MNWLDAFFEKHKGARRILLVWAMILITLVTVWVFDDLSQISGHVVSAYLGVTALLSVAIGFYQWSRHKDET